MTRTVKVIENALDAVIQIILLEKVQNHRETRTKEHSSEVLRVIAVKKMMRGQICDNKCRVTFSKHDSEITKDGKIIGRASKDLVRNLPKLKFGQHFCDACKIRKQAHVSHKGKNMVSNTRCLELLHMDLFDLSVVRSYGGNRYTLVIVDDYSRKCVILERNNVVEIWSWDGNDESVEMSFDYCDNVLSKMHGLYVTIVIFLRIRKLGGVASETIGIPRFDIRLLSYSIVRNPWSSLIPLSRGSFDVMVGMDWLSKKKFLIVCHEKVVRIPIKEGGILRVHGERILGAAKSLMNAKIDEPKLSDISVVRDFIDVFPEDLSMTTAATS
ncbi:retrovirus-related pol polyprotein from transposon TNT 1-94 [Tanacetum coccineum]